MADVAYACSGCASGLAQRLRDAAGHAEDAEATIARQERFGAGSRGGTEEPLPANLAAAEELREISTTTTHWITAITTTIGRRPAWRRMIGPACPRGVRCNHLTCAAIRRRDTIPNPLTLHTAWLAQHVDTLRQHPEAATAFDQLHDVCTQLQRLVDGPADKDLVGVCDCGKVLYAAHGRQVVQCPERTCERPWNVEESRDILRRHLGDKLVTLPEAARLAAYLDSDRTQDGIRKLLAARAGQLVPHGQIPPADGEDEITLTYRFGDVAALLAQIPRRQRKTEGAAA